MPGEFDALLGLNVDKSPEEMQALARQLRGQRDVGDFMSLSQIEPIQKLGIRRAAASRDAAERAGAIRQKGLERARLQGNANRIFEREGEQYDTNRERFIADRGNRRSYDQELLTSERAREDFLAEEDRNRQEGIAAQKQRDAIALAQAKEEAKAKYDSDGGLTENQIRLGTKDLRKRVEPAMKVGASIQEIWNLIEPYGKGGAKEGGNIPGIGLGARTIPARAARAVTGDNEGQDIYAAVSELISSTLRKLAGTAQTFTETQNILKGMGADDFADEETAIRSMTRLSEAYNREMGRIGGGFSPAITRSYSEPFDTGSSPLDFRVTPVDFGYGAHTEEVGASTSEIDDELAAIAAELAAMDANGD